MHLNDIIIAVATPPGRSQRGIIRLSGPGTFALLAHVLPGAPDPLVRGVTHQAIRLTADAPLPVLVLAMPGPHSYTGEDSCEIQCPGNPILIERIIDTLMTIAIDVDVQLRRAEPGEFTARAYFNGRLTLDEAEGVAATIAARSDAELRASHQLLEGRLGRFATQQMDQLAETLGLVEAGIDFTDEEDVIAISPGDLCDRLERIIDALRSQLQHSIGMEQLEAVPWVALVGEPNAGKSTLFNALLGTDRAVTSAVAGTTRDVLVEPLTLHTHTGPAEVMLVDLAGLDDIDQSEVNRHMQQAATDAMQRAELIVRCIACDADHDITPDDTAMIVRTKCDLADHALPTLGAQCVSVSARSGAGVDELRTRIAAHLADRLVSVSADMLALQPRHEAALQSTMECMREALELAEPCRTQRTLSDPEIVAALMRRGLDALGSIIGEMTPDDVLGLVFSRFCIGK